MQGLWYAVRLFMDEEHKDKPLANTTFWNTPWIMKWEYKYATYETVKSDIIKYQQYLQNDAELKILLKYSFYNVIDNKTEFFIAILCLWEIAFSRVKYCPLAEIRFFNIPLSVVNKCIIDQFFMLNTILKHTLEKKLF